MGVFIPAIALWKPSMVEKNTKNIEEIWLEHLNAPDCDVDLAYAKKNFFDSSKESVLIKFTDNVIERTNELRVMPDELFNIYFGYFIDFIIHNKHDDFFASEIADCFINLLNEKLESKSIKDKSLIEHSHRGVDFLYSNIDFYNKDTDIYGDMKPRLFSLKKVLESY